MNMQHLFPVPVGMFDLERGFTDEEMAFVRAQEVRTNEGNSVSINNLVLRDTVMTPLREWIETCVDEYLKTTHDPKSEVRLNITQSWFNYSKPGQYHHKHYHPNSLVSGVLYLNTNLNDKIHFHRAGVQQIKFDPLNWNIYNSDSWWLEAVTGRLILFPSCLEHSVPQVEGSQTRISMAFNTFPVGVVGDESKLTGLKLEV